MTYYRVENLSQLIKRRFLCPNLDTISVSRNVLHHNNDNVGKTGNTWLTTLYSDLLSVWQSVFHMMFVSHKQFQHGRVWCQDNSHIIRHCRTSMGLAKRKKKSDSFILGFLQVLHSGDRFFSTCYIVSWNLTIPALVMLSFQFIVKWEMKSVEGSASGTVEEKITREGRWSSDSYHRWEGRTPWLSVATKVPRLLPVAFFFNGYGLR